MSKERSESEVATRPGSEGMVPSVVPNEGAALLRIALEKGASVEAIEKLMALHERMSDRQAAIEFNQALADFQSECPPIRKTSTASIVTTGGGQYGYKYAELDEIARTTRPLLTKHGLSYTWDSKAVEGLLEVVCTVRHVGGHSQTATFATPIDSPSKMSAQQKVGAALTFARRQSLIQALGLTTADPDKDGALVEKISHEQALNIEDEIARVGADRARFLKYLGVSSVAEIPLSAHERVWTALRDKEKKAKEKGGAS
jgi:hypothetical protein